MSLFKAREFWSTTVGENEEFDQGCLCVAKIDNNNTQADKICVGSYHGYIRVYNVPMLRTENGSLQGGRAEDMLVEVHVGQPVLQLAAARLVPGSEATHLAVLQPRRLQVYTFSVIPGRAEHGTQYQLRQIYEHQLTRTAFNMVLGGFGGVQGRDFTCVQSVDGMLTFFEQESFAFSRFLPESLLPGPLAYVARTDSLVTVSSARQLEAYKYQVVATATDAKTKEESQSIKSGKKVMADWTLNLGEDAISVQVCETQSSVSYIYVLGEHNLYVASEFGHLQFMKRLDYQPTSMLAYQLPSVGQPFCAITSHTNTMLVYHGTALKWASQLGHQPIQLERATFSELKGVVVYLTDTGHLSANFLGTDPSTVIPPSAELREMDYTQLNKELKALNQHIKEMSAKNHIALPSGKQDQQEILIQVQLPSELDQPSRAEDAKVTDDEAIPSITAKIVIKAKTHINDVRVTIAAQQPLVARPDNLFYHSLDPARPAECSVIFHLSDDMVVSDLNVEVNIAYLGSMGAPRLSTSLLRLPLPLVIKPAQPVKSAGLKITVDATVPAVPLDQLFSDLGPGVGNANAVGLQFYGATGVITMLASKTSNRYRIQGDQLDLMWLPLQELTRRLRLHFAAKKDFNITYAEPLPLQEYFQVMDLHFQARLEDKRLSVAMEERAKQFRAVQKRLLTKFKDKTPMPLANMDTLLETSARYMISLAEAAQDALLYRRRVAASLSACTRLVNLLVRCANNLNDVETAILEHALTPIVPESNEQGWEEVVDASVTHLLRTCLSKSSKDQLVNPAPLTMVNDTNKLKKHITLMCERLSKGAKLKIDGQQPVLMRSSTTVTETAAVSSHEPPPATPTVPLLEELGTFYRSESTLGASSVPIGSRFAEKRVYEPSADLSLPSLAVNDHDKGLPSLNTPLPKLDQERKYADITSSVPDLQELERPDSVLDSSKTQGLLHDMAALGL